MLDHVEGLALTAVSGGDPARGLRLLAAAVVWRRRLNVLHDGWWAAQLAAAETRAREALPPCAADAAAAEGRAMTLEQLARYAGSGQLDAAVPADVPLTAREAEIVRLVASGHTTRQVAARLGIGARVVDSTVARVRDKLGLASRPQLAAWAAEHLN